MQADAHAALLDNLGVRRAAVLAASAGGASALQLAIRHPERVSALVLVSSVAPGPYRPALPRPKDLPLRPEDHAVIAEEIRSLLPASQRVHGALFDQFVSNADVGTGYRFDRITAPTLVVHAKDQPGYKGIPGGDAAAAAMAGLIPGAKMLSVDHGATSSSGTTRRSEPRSRPCYTPSMHRGRNRAGDPPRDVDRQAPVPICRTRTPTLSMRCSGLPNRSDQ